MAKSNGGEDSADNGLLIKRPGGTNRKAKHKLVINTFE
jgi:hypothetical protein